MGYEVDFLPVGNESTGGDAIALRYGNLFGDRTEQTVIVVDGGYRESGERLVEHLDNWYETDRVDVVLSTHPDQDHASGLAVVLEECEVGALWMHQPWKHSNEFAALSRRGFRSERLSGHVEASLNSVHELEEIANKFDVPIVEPFTGVHTSDGFFQIVGPTEWYYEELLDEIVQGSSTVSNVLSKLGGVLDKAARAMLPESIYEETLTDAGETTPRNNTSAISLLSFDGRHSLLTGDAGATALEYAADELELYGLGASDLKFCQVPHHGSRRNVGPTILDRMLGGIVESKRGTAFVSAPKKNPESKHPSKKVVNAFCRRGYPVHATQGSTKRHSHEAPDRPGYVKSEPLPFYNEVEDHDDV